LSGFIIHHSTVQGEAKMKSAFKAILCSVALLPISSAMVASAAANVTLTTIQTYAPIVYLNAYENNRPEDVLNFFSQSSLVNSNGTVIAATVTPAILAANTASTNYMVPANGIYPSATNDFESGVTATASSTSGLGQVSAPVYVKVLDFGTYVDIKYFYFYTWNGFEPFRAGIISGLTTKAYNFDWAQFALHYGDWEHVTVRLSEDLSTVQGVFFSEHHGSAWVTSPTMSGTHVIDYAGWNSHANYPTAEVQEEDTILNSPGVIPVSWLKVVDITTNSGTFATYHTPSNFYANGLLWTPSSYVLLDSDPVAAQWLAFSGQWGPSVTETIDEPPSGLPSGGRSELLTLAQAGSTLGLLSSYTSESGPNGPEAVDWDIANEPAE
jgi:hypothetical protein